MASISRRAFNVPCNFDAVILLGIEDNYSRMVARNELQDGNKSENTISRQT